MITRARQGFPGEERVERANCAAAIDSYRLEIRFSAEALVLAIWVDEARRDARTTVTSARSRTTPVLF